MKGTEEEKEALKTGVVAYFLENLSETIDNMKEAGWWDSSWANVMRPDTIKWLINSDNELKKHGDDAAHSSTLAAVRASAEKYMASLEEQNVVRPRIFALLQVHESSRQIMKTISSRGF